ncbi:MAG: alpha/beta fold hydrolase [Polyangiales bacterium]
MPNPILAHALVAAPNASPKKWILFLHGILGSGGNLRTVARGLVAACPAYGAVLVDLRMHGASQGFAPPHTVDACARDLESLIGALSSQSSSSATSSTVSPEASAKAPPAESPADGGAVRGILGHSFGGKVALDYLARNPAQLSHAFIIDSNPGARSGSQGSDMLFSIVAMLRSFPRAFPSRAAFIDSVAARGHGQPLAQWLAMNLERRSDHFALRIDLDAIESLLHDYFARDLWLSLEAPPSETKVIAVTGGRSSAFSTEDLQRLTRAAHASSGQLTAVSIANAGHWVHADDPDGLIEVLTNSLRA